MVKLWVERQPPVFDTVVFATQLGLPGALRVWRWIYSYRRFDPQSASSELTKGDEPGPGVVVLILM